MQAVTLAALALKLVWSDEFNGRPNTPPDPHKWVYDLGAGKWGNHELETYIKSAARQDGRGNLAIRSVRNVAGAYTSARIKTQGKFTAKYGRIEARIKIPYGQGIWPAFWMLGDDIDRTGWPDCGEIDIMENVGKEPDEIHATLHGPGYSGKSPLTGRYTLPGSSHFSGGYHVFSIDWRPGSIAFAVDDHEYYKASADDLPPGAKWVFDHPFYLLLNVAVGGTWPGNPDGSSTFPQTMLVDWVRVYRLE